MSQRWAGPFAARWRNHAPVAAVLCATALLAAAAPARADPNDYVLTLDITGGEREIEAKLGAASASPNGTPAGEAGALSWGVGVNDAWFTEIYTQFANTSAGSRGGGLDSVSWENVVRFSQPGEWPVDVGAMLEIERPRAGSQGWKITTGPLFQTDLDRIQLNLNILFERIVDGQPFEPTQISYQFQARLRADPHLEFGVQALGDLGAWNHWGNPDGQAQRLGPAIFGRFNLGHARALSYNAALLFGLDRAAADTTVRAQIEYEY
jgi:hypothetical protein